MAGNLRIMGTEWKKWCIMCPCRPTDRRSWNLQAGDGSGGKEELNEKRYGCT